MKSLDRLRLNEAATQAVRRWRFTPAQVADTDAASRVDVPIRCRLSAKN